MQARIVDWESEIANWRQIIAETQGNFARSDLLRRNTGTYAETQAAEQLFSYGDFGISRLMIRVRRPNTLAWVMCQNLPTNMVISPMNTKIEMARAEVCRKRMFLAWSRSLVAE